MRRRARSCAPGPGSPAAISFEPTAILSRVSDLLRVACVQMTSGPDNAANIDTAGRLAARAASTGAEPVARRETWNAIGCPNVLHAAAEPLEAGESVAALAGWARSHGITLIG